MTSIRRVPGSAAAPAAPVAKPTVAPSAPARADGASSFDPFKFVKRLINDFNDLRTPGATIDKQAARTDWFNAPLQVNGITAESDVKQGGLGDCYMVSTVAAIAHQHPEILQNAMKENSDGTVSFRFFARDGGQLKPTWVTVTRELPMRADGTLPFGSSKQNEAWFPLLEKAYAQFKGGYSAIGNGGYPSDAQEALLGTSARNTRLAGMTADAVYDSLKAGLARGDIIGATTPPAPDGKKTVIQTMLDAFKSAIGGIVPHHVYSVWGTQEHDGKKYVLLRNPWATNEPGSFGPFALDGKNDGVFAMPMDDFMKRFTWTTSSPASTT